MSNVVQWISDWKKKRGKQGSSGHTGKLHQQPRSNITYRPGGPDVYEQIKWNGWGAKDMVIETDPNDPMVVRHLSGHAQRKIVPFVNEVLGTVNKPMTPSPSIDEETAIGLLPTPILNTPFLQALEAALKPSQVKLDGAARLTHIMGKNYRDLWRLRRGMIDRAPDAVVLPESHADCAALMEAAHEHNVVIIPYGGGTNVVGAIEPNPFEKKRMIVSVDMRRMNRLLSIDTQSRVAVFQTGVLGPDLDKQLEEYGFMFGHDPDSYLHSTLGGWIGARSSGSMSNRYGDIEDMVLAMKVATPTGVVETKMQPRVAGQDFNAVIIGSEGILGIVTEATVKIEPIPAVKHYEGWLFPSFKAGCQAFETVTVQNVNPTVMRLYDKDDTQLSFAMKLDEGKFKDLVSIAIKKFLVHVKGFDLKEICLCIVGFEGSKQEVSFGRSRLNPIFKQAGAFNVGEGAGANWQFKKYDLPYLRDWSLSNTAWADVFETTTRYSEVIALHGAVKRAVRAEWDKAGKVGLIGCHLAHQYKTGCCLYFTYLGEQTDENDFELFLRTKRAATAEMLRHKGNVSHHHGVGFEMVPWMAEYYGTPLLSWMFTLKQHIDPKGICNPGKLLPLPPLPGETPEELDARRRKFQMFDKMALPSQRAVLRARM